MLFPHLYLSRSCFAIFVLYLLCSAQPVIADVTWTGIVTPNDPTTWTSSTTGQIGEWGNGTLDIADGSTVSSKRGYIGNHSDATGVVTVDGNGSTWTNSDDLSVGPSGDGSLNITNGGIVSVGGETWVSRFSGSTGTIHLENGTLTTGGLLVAAGDLTGTGTINANGLVSDVDLVFDATHGLNQTILFDDEVGQNVTVQLNVDGTGAMGAGYGGVGTMSIADGVVVQSTRGVIGHKSGSSGQVTVSGTGSRWETSDHLGVGNGSLTITNGGQVSGLSGGIAATGQVTVDGAGSSLTAGLFGVTGTLAVTNGGSVVVNATSNLSDSAGTVTVDGIGSTWSSSSLWVGYSGNSTLGITNGGTVSSYNGTVGYNTGSVGVVTVDGAGSTWTNSNNLLLGRAGSGTLNITGGATVAVANDTRMTHFAGSSGEIHFDNGTLTTGNLFVNFNDISGTGTINTNGMVSDVDLIFDATHGLTQTLVVDGNLNQNVTVNLEVSSMTRNLGAGHIGTGTMSISGGITVPTIDGTIGNKVGSIGQATVDGAGSTWTQSQYLYVGREGNGTLNVTNAGTIDSRWSRIGNEAGSTGTVTIDGTTSTWTMHNLDVGREGDGTLNITGGGTVDTTNALVGYTGSSTGQVNVSGIGSTWKVNRLRIGFNNNEGSSTLEIVDGGLVRVDSKLDIDLHDQNGSDFINLSTGGMLAIIGDADDSLAQFLGLVGGSDAIRYWDDNLSDWADLGLATLGDDYTLSFQNAGDLSGYTLLTVGSPFPDGDYDLDGDVDGADFLTWQSSFGSTTNLDADGNDNGTVDAADYTIWRDNFGAGTSSLANQTSVPEPSSAVMLLVIAGMLSVGSRRCSWAI